MKRSGNGSRVQVIDPDKNAIFINSRGAEHVLCTVSNPPIEEVTMNSLRHPVRQSDKRQQHESRGITLSLSEQSVCF